MGQAYKQGTHWEGGPSKSIKEFINYLKKGDKILDVGCGSSRDSIYLAKKGYDVIGLDISAEAIRKARTKVSYSNLHFIEGKAEDLPFENESFDAVYSTWTLNFCSLAEPAAEIYRVLRKEGIAYLAFLLTTEPEERKIKKFKSKEGILQAYNKFKLLKKKEYKSKDFDPKLGHHLHKNLMLVLKK